MGFKLTLVSFVQSSTAIIAKTTMENMQFTHATSAKEAIVQSAQIWFPVGFVLMETMSFARFVLHLKPAVRVTATRFYAAAAQRFMLVESAREYTVVVAATKLLNAKFVNVTVAATV